MVPTNLYFDFRDIFRAPRLALSGKKIWVIVTGNTVGFVFYWILSYVALSISGQPFSQMLDKHGLYPHLFATDASVVAWLFYVFGIAIWLTSIMFSFAGVSRITLKQLKGNDFFTGDNAWGYVKKHWHPVVLTSISLLFIIFLFLIFGIFFAYICSIPVIGSYFYVIPFPIYLVGSIFTIYTILVTLVSIFYAPAIVGTYEEDTMGTLFQSYSITWSQPWRIILYNSIIFPLSYLGIITLTWVGTAGIGLIQKVFGTIIQEKINNFFIFSNEIVFSDNLIFQLKKLGMMDLSYLLSEIDKPVFNFSNVDVFAGVIFSLFMFLMLLTIFSYGFSILAVGKTIEFIIFKKNSDNDDLLKRRDEDDLIDNEDLSFYNNENISKQLAVNDFDDSEE